MPYYYNTSTGMVTTKGWGSPTKEEAFARFYSSRTKNITTEINAHEKAIGTLRNELSKLEKTAEPFKEKYPELYL